MILNLCVGVYYYSFINGSWYLDSIPTELLQARGAHRTFTKTKQDAVFQANFYWDNKLTGKSGKSFKSRKSPFVIARIPYAMLNANNNARQPIESEIHLIS